MDNYQNFYTPPEPPEEQKPLPEQGQIPTPEQEAVPEIFYYTPDSIHNLTPPPVQPIPMNRKILTMVSVMAGMIFLLCIYCMVADILHGALHGDTVHNTVRIQMQEKPVLDPNDENVTSDMEYTVKAVAELVRPSIVEVYVYQDSRLTGTGSGIIITEDGYIITNAHVVQGNDYTVELDDKTQFTAQLVGSDSKTDLAVLKVSAGNLTPANLGNSDEVYVGENVVAIGNPAGLANTVTKGIVSAVNRQIRAESSAFMMDCIQTDAAISPGNSGGALVNMYGQVIGITSSKYASAYEATYEGLGFAITTNQALPIIQDLIENGYVSGRFRIGITFMSTAVNTEYISSQFEEIFGSEMPEELKNALWITDISEDCDISHTDLQVNDFILQINGESVSGYDSVLEVLDGCKGGDTVTAHCARYERNKVAYFDIEFKLEEDTSGKY